MAPTGCGAMDPSSRPMGRRVATVIYCCACLVVLHAANAVEGASSTLISSWCASSVRVRIAPGGATDLEPTLGALLSPPVCPNATGQASASLVNGNIAAAFTPLLTVRRVSDGAVLLAEVRAWRHAVPCAVVCTTEYVVQVSHTQTPRGEVDVAGHPLYESSIVFARQPGDTGIYGLGEHKTGRVNYGGGWYWRFEDSQVCAGVGECI